ncbi:hypothetical protein EU642_22100 [Salmonella enterica]|nr:hypothetical protein [Salmonella enterica]EAO0118547.1 hypothetical protein [Salmonella enterica]EAO3601652.1 hypothetical protein [Salmonella enterica]EAR6391545.1 hypothetical protein [Salmonella enterica]EAV1285309.1 hypothetical protein [Salmonella enterica]
MAILVESGRAAVATAISNQPIHLAWGSGEPAWDAVVNGQPEDVGSTKLVNELGRRTVTQKQYCTPKADGEIIVSQGRFTRSVVPTKYLYLRFAFDFNDAAQADIRELGIFVGSTTVAKPATTDYYLPSEVTDQGQLLVSENIDKLTRSQQIRQQFEFVIQF